MLSSDNSGAGRVRAAPDEPPASRPSEVSLAEQHAHFPLQLVALVKRLTLTPEGRDALAEARAASDLVRDHRQQAATAAERRFLAVMEANSNGASYRVLADVLDVSIGMVQQWMAAARRHRAAR